MIGSAAAVAALNLVARFPESTSCEGAPRMLAFRFHLVALLCGMHQGPDQSQRYDDDCHTILLRVPALFDRYDPE